MLLTTEDLAALKDDDERWVKAIARLKKAIEDHDRGGVLEALEKILLEHGY